MRKRNGCDIMKQKYMSPTLELAFMSRDVITSSSQPWVADVKWDLSKYSSTASDIDEMN